MAVSERGDPRAGAGTGVDQGVDGGGCGGFDDEGAGADVGCSARYWGDGGREQGRGEGGLIWVLGGIYTKTEYHY